MQEAAKNIKPVNSSKVLLTRERTDWHTAAFDQEITISKRVAKGVRDPLKGIALQQRPSRQRLHQLLDFPFSSSLIVRRLT